MSESGSIAMWNIYGWYWRIRLRYWEYRKHRVQAWVLTPNLVLDLVGLVRRSHLKRYNTPQHGNLNITVQYDTVGSLIEDLVVFNHLLLSRDYIDQTLIQHVSSARRILTLDDFLIDSNTRSVLPTVVVTEFNKFIVQNLLLMSELKGDRTYDYYQRLSLPLYQNIYTITETLAQINWR